MAEFDDLIDGESAGFGSGRVGALGFGGAFPSGGWGRVRPVGGGRADLGGFGHVGTRGRGAAGPGGFGYVRSAGFGTGASMLAPTIGVGGGGVGPSSSGYGFSVIFGGGNGGNYQQGFGGALTNGGWGNVGARGFGGESAIPESLPLTLLQTPGFMYMTVGYDFVAASSGLAFSDAASDALTWTATDILTIASTVSAQISNGSMAGADAISFRDTSSVISYLALNSAVTFADNGIVTHYALLAAASMLHLTGAVDDSLVAIGAVATAFVLADSAGIGRQIADDLESTLELSDAAVDSIRGIVAAVDTMTFDETSGATMFAFGAASSALTLGDAASGLLSGMIDGYDSITFVGLLRLLGVDYTAYSVSLDNQAISEYENYNFNSFGVCKGIAYGAGEAGIYIMDGPTDDGEPIIGRVRGPLSNLGTAFKKAVPAVYVGYSSTNRLGLKVITTDGPNGAKKVNLYSLSPIAKQATTDARFTPSKGLHSVYWQFELISEDGGQFELDEVRMWRMVLTRRK